MRGLLERYDWTASEALGAGLAVLILGLACLGGVMSIRGMLRENEEEEARFVRLEQAAAQDSTQIRWLWERMGELDTEIRKLKYPVMLDTLGPAPFGSQHRPITLDRRNVLVWEEGDYVVMRGKEKE